MGLSRVFPCRRRRQKEKEKEKENKREGRREKGRQKKQAQQEGSAGNSGSANDRPPSIPLVPQVSSHKNSGNEGPNQRAPSEVQEGPNRYVSHRVWNRAYDELASDGATKKLVEAYTKVLKKARKPGDGATISEADENVDDMKDAAQRDKVMREALKSVQAKVYKSTEFTDAAGGVSSFILKFKDVIDFAVGNIPQAALPWAGVSISLTFLLNPVQESKANLDGIGHVTSRMEWYCSLTDHLLSRKYLDIVDDESYEAVRKQLEGRVVELYKALLLYQMKSVCSYYGNQGWAFVRNLVNLDDWKAQLEGVKAAEAAVKSDSKQYNNALGRDLMGKLVADGENTQKILGDFDPTLKGYIESQSKRHMDQDSDRCLTDLYVVDPQIQMATIEGKNDKLLPAAYNWILDTVEYKALIDWSDKSSCQVLWLKGPAGTGKTMLMLGIISEIYGQLSNSSPDISYFFFQAEEPQNSAMDAIRSTMWLLLIQQPHLLSHMIETHKRSGAAMFNRASAFYSLVNTFKKMLADETLSPVYLAFDALDECADGKPGIQDLISLVSDTLGMTGKVKWILSSRPGINVHQRLSHMKARAVVELNVQDHKEPVNAYIAYKLSEIQQSLGYDQKTLDTLEVEIRRRAQNTVLWAVLVLKSIINRRLSKRNAVKEVQRSPESLFGLYDRMMDQINKQEEEHQMFCKALLAAVCFASRPVSFAEVHVLAGLLSEIESDEIVESCGSFLTVRGKIVHLLHNSTREYLTAHFQRFKGEIHLDMSNRSIAAMSEGLRYNIYNLHPGSESADIRPSESDDHLASLRYSCEFWVDHLCKGAGPLLDDRTVFAFLETHFLHWLESLSLLHKLSAAVPSIRELLSKVKSIPTESSKLVYFLEDAEKFTLKNLTVMTHTPLQIYASALLFSPKKSEIKTRFWEQRSPFIGSITGIGDHWDYCLQTLDAQDGTSAVVFSPDSKYFATAASGVVQLWDAATGDLVQEHQRDYTYRGLVAFSPNGEALTLVSTDKLRIIDVATGTCRKTFDPGCSIINSMACSPDGKLVAFADPRTVYIYDASTWIHKRTLEGHYPHILSMAFSPNSKILASASTDQRVRLWDPIDGTCKQILEQGTKVHTVLFQDSNTVASVLYDQKYSHKICLRTWDIESGVCKQTLGEDADPDCAVFSPCGKTVAIAEDATVALMDAATEKYTHAFNHGTQVASMAFSKESNLLVSASFDGSVRVWDVSRRMKEEPPGPQAEVSKMRFSPEGNTLATASLDGTVKLWDPIDKQLKHTLEGSDHPVLAFSPDGSTIATASLDTIRFWDTRTGHCKQILPDIHEALALSFSPDGTVAAISTEEQGRTRLYDIATGTCKQDLQGHKDWVRQLSFSKDGKTLATGTNFGGAQVWDLVTGECRQTLVERKTQTEVVTCIALSPDGKTVASSLSRMSAQSSLVVQLWDVALGVCKQTLDMTFGVKELSFSDDGQYLNTNHGSLAYTSGFLARIDPNLSRSPVFLDRSWAMRGEQKLLYLPPDYDTAAVYGNTLALGRLGGQMVFLEFADC